MLKFLEKPEKKLLAKSNQEKRKTLIDEIRKDLANGRINLAFRLDQDDFILPELTINQEINFKDIVKKRIHDYIREVKVYHINQKTLLFPKKTPVPNLFVD